MIIKRKRTDIDPRKEPGEVNRFGVKILWNGDQYVIDARTRLPAKRDGYVCMKTMNNLYVWIRNGEKIEPGEVLCPSVWDGV